MEQESEHSWNPKPVRFPASLSPHPHLKLLLCVIIGMKNTHFRNMKEWGESNSTDKNKLDEHKHRQILFSKLKILLD